MRNSKGSGRFSIREILPALLRGEPWFGEFRLRHARTGDAITVDMRAFGIFGRYGQLLGFASISRDITARQQAEETRQRLASIVEFSHDAIISESLDGIDHHVEPRGRNDVRVHGGGGDRAADHAAGVAWL